jgi:predicted DNA-binding transcriptional regulator AlpA
MDGTVKLLNTGEAAALIGVTRGTLKWWRHIGKGPKFIKFGTSKQSGVGYDPADIDGWKAARKFASTSAYSEAGQRNAKPQMSRSAEVSA